MLFSLLWALYFWLVYILSLLLYIPYLLFTILRLLFIRDHYLKLISSLWARHILWSAGARVNVEGLEQIPAHNRICVVANHQGYADIALIVGYIPKIVGFIAKRELAWVPILNLWAKTLHCLFLDRKRHRAAVKVMEKGVKQIRQGQPMLIFPEGTRSKGGNIATFKPGSLKLALRSQATIVPVTIQGSYKLYEQHKRIKGARIKLTVHPPLEVSTLSPGEQKELAGRLREIIASALSG